LIGSLTTFILPINDVEPLGGYELKYYC